MTRNEATKETTNFIHFKSNVIDAAGVSFDAANVFASRIAAAFDMGEPVWMVADEIKLRVSAPKPRKTPRQLAVRVVQFS